MFGGQTAQLVHLFGDHTFKPEDITLTEEGRERFSTDPVKVIIGSSPDTTGNT